MTVLSPHKRKIFDKKVIQKYVTKRVIQHHIDGINTTKGYNLFIPVVSSELVEDWPSEEH